MPSANAKWYRLPNDGLLVLSEGDITSWSGDAIVNAGGRAAAGGPAGRRAAAGGRAGGRGRGAARAPGPHLQGRCAVTGPPRADVLIGALPAANERMLGGGGVDGGAL
jgi:O-acetyl-ADP-ribose deacetylase (regulator of RNase III)